MGGVDGERGGGRGETTTEGPIETRQIAKPSIDSIYRVALLCWLWRGGVGEGERGGKRRKRHLARSKIIQHQ